MSKDKVWHYYARHSAGSFGEPQGETIGPILYFSTDYEVINGKNYFALMREKTPSSDADTLLRMRQEEGKVIFLVDGRIKDNIFAYDKDLEIGDEILVFDFDAKTGDIYRGLVAGDMGSLELTDLKIESVDTIEKYGQRLIRQNISCPEHPFRGEIPVVEGIGTGINLFFLPLLGDAITGSPTYGQHIDYVLREVTDKSGNAVFRQKDFTDGEDQSYLPFIREDRVWEYFTTDHDYMSYGHCRLYRWQFIGKEEFEGKNYHRLMQTGQTLWTDHHDNDGTYSDYAEDTSRSLVALMREKSGKVYVRLKDGNNDELQPNFTEERLLYDFGLHPGDTLSFPWYPDGYISRQTFVADTIDIEYSFEASRILNFVPIEEESAYAPAFAYSNTAGNLGLGDMVFINLGPFLSCDCGHTALNNVYDLNGNILYKGENNKAPDTDDIKDIESDAGMLIYAEGVVRAEGEGRMTLEVFSADGAKIGQAEGYGSITVSASGLVPGIYIATLKVGGRQTANLRFPAG